MMILSTVVRFRKLDLNHSFVCKNWGITK